MSADDGHRLLWLDFGADGEQVRTRACMSFHVSFDTSFIFGARCSSVVRAFAHGAMGRQIDPSWWTLGVRCSSVVRAFDHGAMGRRIDSSWGGPIELFLVPARGARCSSVVRAFGHGAIGHRIDPSRGGPIELFLVPASAPRLV